MYRSIRFYHTWEEVKIAFSLFFFFSPIFMRKMVQPRKCWQFRGTKTVSSSLLSYSHSLIHTVFPQNSHKNTRFSVILFHHLRTFGYFPMMIPFLKTSHKEHISFIHLSSYSHLFLLPFSPFLCHSTFCLLFLGGKPWIVKRKWYKQNNISMGTGKKEKRQIRRVHQKFFEKSKNMSSSVANTHQNKPCNLHLQYSFLSNT